jgi:hypothetical protein
MAVSMISDRESEQELQESHLMLKSAWLCFRTSSSFVGNNPSLQIPSFSEDRGKGNKIGSPSIINFSTILTSHIRQSYPSGRKSLLLTVQSLHTS